MRTIVLAEKSGPDGKGASEPFEILRTGVFQHPTYGKMKITEKDLDQAVSNFDRMMSEGHQPSIDYDHAFSTRGDSKAAGWIETVKRTGGKLLATVKWTGSAATAIGAGEYRYFSPEFNEKWKDSEGKSWGFTLLAGGLTNRPYLKGMSPVALNDRVADELTPAKFAEPADRRGMDATEQNDTTPKDAKDETPEAPEAPEAKVLSETATKTLTEENKRLHDRVEGLETKIFESDFTRVFSDARRAGRVDAQEETEGKWRKRAEEWGIESVTTLLSELPTYIPVEERGSAADPGDPSLAEGDVDPGRQRMADEARKLSEEKGITFTEALIEIDTKASA